MAYMQLGSVDPSHFNCTKYPGICKPSDSATLAIFKNLQAQLNRVAQGLGLSKISVDGDIGNDVLSLISQISANMSQGGVSADPARNILIQAGAYSSVDAASNADTLANACVAAASQMNVPAKITQPASGSSTLVSASGAEQKVSTPTPASASILDSLGGLSTTEMLAIGAGLGAIAYVVGKKPKRGAGGAKSSRKTSARARSRSSRRSPRRHRR
jgi:hypothetical protein